MIYNILISFVAGVLSILSPCILPILPSFLGYITGLSLSDGYQGIEKKLLRKKLIIDTLLFGIGFSIIFLFFGAVIGSIGEILLLNRPVFEKIAGIMIIIFGLQLTGILKIKSLLKDRKIEIPKRLTNIQHLRSFFIGMAFSFGWAPCYGPIVGTIFTLAATKADFWQGILLFGFYSIGFLVPLLGMTFLVTQTNSLFQKIKKFSKYSSLIAGIFVIILGILLLTKNLNLLVNWINLIYTQNNISLL